MIEKLVSISLSDYLSAFGTLLGTYELVNPNTQKKVRTWLKKTFSLRNVQNILILNLAIALLLGFLFQYIPFLISIFSIGIVLLYKPIMNIIDFSESGGLGGGAIIVYILLLVLFYILWGLGQLIPDSVYVVYTPIEYVTESVNLLVNFYPRFDSKAVANDFILRTRNPIGIYDVTEVQGFTNYINLLWLLFKASPLLAHLSILLACLLLIYGIYRLLVFLLTLVAFPLFSTTDWIIAKTKIKKTHFAVLGILIAVISQIVKFVLE